jgi:acetylglutamate kinase
MLPKVDAALTALDGGASRVRIAEGRRPNALRFALLAGPGIGTEILG